MGGRRETISCSSSPKPAQREYPHSMNLQWNTIYHKNRNITSALVLVVSLHAISQAYNKDNWICEVWQTKNLSKGYLQRNRVSAYLCVYVIQSGWRQWKGWMLIWQTYCVVSQVITDTSELYWCSNSALGGLIILQRGHCHNCVTHMYNSYFYDPIQNNKPFNCNWGGMLWALIQ